MKNLSKSFELESSANTNYEGGKSYKMSLEESIAEFFSLGLLNGNFYQSQSQVIKNAGELFRDALKHCPEFATKAAIYGNNVNSLKLVPTIWLVYLSTLEDKALFKKAFPRIIRNPKMLNDFVEICRKGGIRNGLGRAVKETINEWLDGNLNPYQASRNKGKLKDIVSLTRPKSNENDFQQYMKYLMKNELTFGRAIALKRTIDILKDGTLTEEVVAIIKTHNLQLEELKHSVSNLNSRDKQALYIEMYKGLNYAALILNLVSFERVFATKLKGPRNTVEETDIPEYAIDMIVEKIRNIDAYRKSNMLPFALINAEKMVVTPEFKKAISDVLKEVANSTFDIDKDISIMLGVDTSASMYGTEISNHLTCGDIANIFGSLVKKAHTKTNVFAVASQIKKVDLKKQDDIFSMARQIKSTNVGYGTYFEQLMDKYNGEKYVILLTDSMNADDLEEKWIKNKDKPEGAKLIVWQLESYQSKISKDPSVLYLAGYSDRLLGLIKNIIEGKGGQIEEINNIEI